MAHYPIGEWYRNYISKYDERYFKLNFEQMMEGTPTNDSDKKEYHKLLDSGMFFEFHPELSGDWELDKNIWNDINSSKVSNETYLDLENNIQTIETELREKIMQLEYKLEDARDTVEIIQSEIQSILSALSNAVENGIQLNIGIVLGQTMSKLSDIANK